MQFQKLTMERYFVNIHTQIFKNSSFYLLKKIIFVGTLIFCNSCSSATRNLSVSIRYDQSDNLTPCLPIEKAFGCQKNLGCVC